MTAYHKETDQPVIGFDMGGMYKPVTSLFCNGTSLSVGTLRADQEVLSPPKAVHSEMSAKPSSEYRECFQKWR